MTLLTYESSANITPRWSLLALFSFGAGLLNLLLVIAALYAISQIDDPNAGRCYAILLLLETAPVAFLGVSAVACVMNSRGRLCGLIPAAIGSFLASSSGLLVAIVGTQFAIVRFLPSC